MGFVSDVVVKKKNLVQVKGRKNIYISAYFLSYICGKEEVGQEVDKTISDISKILQSELLTIYGDPVCELYGMFENLIYLFIFYYLCFVEDISVDIAYKQVMEDIDPDLEWQEDFRISYYR